MKRYRNPLLCMAVSLTLLCGLQAQRRVSEMSLTYEVEINRTTPDGKLISTDAAQTIIYLKGPMSRNEMTSGLFTTVTIHDARTGSAVALREISGQKLLIRMTPENWLDRNKKYAALQFTTTSESKTIAGYSCVKAEAQLPDGTLITVYYTPDLLPENKEYDYTFRTLNGLPLEWTVVQGRQTIRFLLNKLNMNPIPVSRFEIPKSGYRELTYEESTRTNN